MLCAATRRTRAPFKTCVGTAVVTTAALGTAVIAIVAGSATVAGGKRSDVSNRPVPEGRVGLLPLPQSFAGRLDWGRRLEKHAAALALLG
jgi:hypothetical protein